MSSLNKVMLIGNLGRDPEVRTKQDGGKIVTLSIATSQRWRDKHSGERREKTEWHRVVIFNENIAEIAEQYLAKGAKCYVEGELQTRKWTDDKDGIDRYTTEVVLGNFNGKLVLLGSKGDDSGDGKTEHEAKPGGPKKGSYNPQKQDNPAQGEAKGGKDFDDDIPF